MAQAPARSPDQWLVRTSQNVIAGPYPREQVIQMIKDRNLRPQDEVCPANSYWFNLHEHPEVLKFLGPEGIPVSDVSVDEVTQTQTETLTETQTVTELTEERKAKLAMGSAHIDDETTGILSSNRTIRQPALDRKTQGQPATQRPRPSAAPGGTKMERPVLAWVLIGILSMLALGVIYVVLQVLSSKGPS